MKYMLRKHGRYGSTIDYINEYANENSLAVTYAYVGNKIIAILGNTMVRVSGYVVIQEECVSSAFTFKRGFPERKVIKENNSYRSRIIENTRQIRGIIDVYEIW